MKGYTGCIVTKVTSIKTGQDDDQYGITGKMFYILNNSLEVANNLFMVDEKENCIRTSTIQHIEKGEDEKQVVVTTKNTVYYLEIK